MVDRILTEGPAYYDRYSIKEGQADWRNHALDAEVWLRLNMLELAGRLSAVGAGELAAIKARRAYLARGVEDQDFFGSYSTGVHMVVGDAQPIIDAAEGERLQVAREVLGSHDIEKQQGWSTFCRTNPRGAFDTLRTARLDDANAPLWRDLIGALTFPDGEKDPDRRSIVVALFATLEPAEAPFLALVVDRLADLYWSSPRQTEPAIAAWWPRLGVADAAKALRNGPLSLRSGAAELVKQWIHQIDPDRAVAWRTGIGPLLLAVWARERTFREQEFSRHFADLAVESGDAFPEALKQLLPHISVLEGHGGIYAIERSEAPEKFARETLILLWKLFGHGTTSDLYGVPKILDRLIAALPAIELDRRLQWLDQKAPRYE